MLNILIPMAGAGSRFIANGYKVPKPLILINNIPMIRIVIENLRPKCPHRFIFICQQAHIDSFHLREKLSNWAPGSITIGIDRITGGSACTVLVAKKLINNENPLMIANCDQYIDTSIDDYLEFLSNSALDGLIMTMKASDLKWSYVGLNSNGCVARVVEKQVISNDATVGIYNFKMGQDFVFAAEAMISLNLRTNNEFYVAPCYNQLIVKEKRIRIYNVGSEANGMYGLGTPEDLVLFMGSPIHTIATRLQ